MKAIFVALGFLYGCVSPNMPDEEDNNTPVVELTDDDEVEAFDGGDQEIGRRHAEIELCSVIIMFNFIGDRAESVEFENNNDVAVIVRVADITTGGTVVENCLWSDNTDSEEADFSATDELRVEVYLGQGQFFQYTCVQLIDDVLNIFDLCGSMTARFD